MQIVFYRWCLINFLHSGSIFFVTLKRWHLCIISCFSGFDICIVFIDSKPKLNHSMDSLGMNCWILEREARAEEGSLEEKQH